MKSGSDALGEPCMSRGYKWWSIKSGGQNCSNTTTVTTPHSNDNSARWVWRAARVVYASRWVLTTPAATRRTCATSRLAHSRRSHRGRSSSSCTRRTGASRSIAGRAQLGRPAARHRFSSWASPPARGPAARGGCISRWRAWFNSVRICSNVPKGRCFHLN